MLIVLLRGLQLKRSLVLRISFLFTPPWCAERRVDGGRFFIGDIMQVDIVDGHTVRIKFDKREAHFIQCDCLNNDITVKELFRLLFDVLFNGGYMKLIRRE